MGNVRKLVHNQGIEEVVKGCGVADNPALLATLKTKFGYDYHNPPAAFECANMVAMYDYIREQIYPYVTFDTGFEKIGYYGVQEHFNGFVGKANKLAAKLLGAERATEIFLKAVKTAFPWGEPEMEELRKGFARFRMQKVLIPPSYMRGVIKAGLEAAGAKNIVIAITVKHPEDFWLDCSWE
jgi:uncharacterized protein (TIGR02265 family)